MAKKRKIKQVKLMTYHPIGLLYASPIRSFDAVQDGVTIHALETEVDESGYPKPPIKRQYTVEQFFQIPLYKDWDTRLTRDEIELALIGQLQQRNREWPHWYIHYDHFFPVEDGVVI